MPKGEHLRKPSHTTDDMQKDRGDTTANISTSGAATVNFEEPQIDVIQPGMMLSLAEQERLMNSMVEVEIEADDDPNSPIFCLAGHNGVNQYVQRGVPQKIKLRFLYSMLASKATKFACAFGKDASGNEFNRLTGRANTTYRIRIGDVNPDQRKVIRQAMAEA